MKTRLLIALLTIWSGCYAQHMEEKIRQLGLVDIHSLDTTIKVCLKYATDDNFMKEVLYDDLHKAYFEKEFAKRVVSAQKILKEKNPRYTLLIYDAARPLSIQRKMYNKVKGTALRSYVAPPPGGRHNYGVAVDLTIADEEGNPLDMGTEFDFFGMKANVGNEKRLVEQGKITAVAAENRALLYSVMREAGLVPYAKEWWHYQQTIPMSAVRERYKLLNF